MGTFAKAKLVEKILNIPSNRATRFVYLRTLPLAKQAELTTLEGEVEKTAASIETCLTTVIEKHATKELDARGCVHLHSGGLAIATHQVLEPKIGTERASELVREAFGVGRALPAHAITKAALWFTRDRLRATKKMAQNAVSDFGPEFDAEVQDADDSCRLVVSTLIQRFTK